MNKFLFWLEKYFAAGFYSLLAMTWKYEILSCDKEKKGIFIIWHRNILPLLYTRRNENICLMISSSKDGELIAGPAEVLGYQTARGSSRRGASSATRKMVKLSRQGFSLAITPDGPKGPPKIIKEGLISLAYFTKLPIYPISVDVEKEWIFNSWDKFRLPKPFSKIKIKYGKPIAVENKEKFSEYLSEIQTSMNEMDVSVKTSEV